MLGILYALALMFSWGSIGFISNKISRRPNQKTLGMTLGAILFSSVIWLIVKSAITLNLWIFRILGWDFMVCQAERSI